MKKKCHRDNARPAHLQRHPTFKENNPFLSPDFYFGFIRFSEAILGQSLSGPEKKASQAEKQQSPRMRVCAVVKFRISWKGPALRGLSPYPETPFSQDSLVTRCHSPIREPSGVIFNSCLSITTQRKGLELATARIFCRQNKGSAGV